MTWRVVNVMAQNLVNRSLTFGWFFTPTPRSLVSLISALLGFMSRNHCFKARLKIGDLVFKRDRGRKHNGKVWLISNTFTIRGH